MEQNKIVVRIEKLRSWMKEKGITYYIISTSDYHQTEYVGDFFKAREFFTGFTGSNGTLVIGQGESGLWTDGRYFIQAENELEGSGIKLFKMEEEGVPTIVEYLNKKVFENDVIGFNGNIIDAETGLDYAKKLASKKVTFSYFVDAAKDIWLERTSLPQGKIRTLETSISGETVESKLGKVRETMKKEGATQYLLSKLDDLMWLFNIRGCDIPCNPLALSYGFITLDKAYLFVQEESKSDEFELFCIENSIELMKYEEILEFLLNYNYKGAVLCNYSTTCYAFYEIMKAKTEIIKSKDPTELLKAIKNAIEIENMKEIYLQDSAAVVKFLYWLKTSIGKKEITEVSAAKYIDSLRSQIPSYLDLSFPTISAYKENAAMMHYKAGALSNKTVEQEGMLLIDSGGQYLGGTTDVTRTAVLGKISEECKQNYTAVVSGVLQLSAVKFLYGCTGRNLDILARQPMWDLNIDYKCGTGHGIGYILNVHEGPHNIHWRYKKEKEEYAFEAGMIVTIEPGVYKAGEYGIRVENVLLCKESIKNGDGRFMNFETLTFVPIDLDGIDVSFLTKENKDRLNSYHKQVFENISPYLKDNEIAWLRENTKAI